MGAILWAQLLGSGTRRRISVKGTFATTDRRLPRLLSFFSPYLCLFTPLFDLWLDHDRLDTHFTNLRQSLHLLSFLIPSLPTRFRPSICLDLTVGHSPQFLFLTLLSTMRKQVGLWRRVTSH